MKLTPTFTSGKMKLMFEIIDKIGDKLVTVIENETKTSGMIEVHDYLARFTTDNISNVAFGLESNSLDDFDSMFRMMGKEVLDLDAFGFLKFFFTSSFPGISRKMHLTANKKNVIDFFYNTFKNNMEYRERNNIVRKDFLQILLELKKTACLTVSELAAESFIFFVGEPFSIHHLIKILYSFPFHLKGGFETSSSLMNFTLYELSINEDVQKKLRNEITEMLDENDGILTYDLLFSLKYLDMIMNETLRKYPPAFIITRNSTKDFNIAGTDMTIPANTDININVLSIHRDPEYYPDPDKFDPERFTPENVKTRKPFTFIPFGKDFYHK
jgi:cytochrome P450 family 6